MGSLAVSVVLLAQGIHILRNGDTRPFFLERRRAHIPPDLTVGSKYIYGALYISISASIYCVLGLALWRNGARRFVSWFENNLGFACLGLFLVGYGMLAVLRPDIVLRWVTSAYADYDLDGAVSTRYIARGVGACLVGIGLYVFAKL